jgi:hypothetical protein
LLDARRAARPQKRKAGTNPAFLPHGQSARAGAALWSSLKSGRRDIGGGACGLSGHDDREKITNRKKQWSKATHRCSYRLVLWEFFTQAQNPVN